MMECPRCLTCFDDGQALCPLDGSQLEISLPGTRLIDDKYAIERILGKGGMGTVYLVQHLGLEKRFALKLIRPSETIRERFLTEFQSEARVLGRLKHGNIVEVTDYGTDIRNGGTPYLVMEYLEGTTLKTRIRETGPLALGAALPILDQIGQAIDYAHELGILHCDIKPSNIFLYRSADHHETVKILDFGLAILLRTHESDHRSQRAAPLTAATPHKSCGAHEVNATDSTSSTIPGYPREEADGAIPQALGFRGIRGTLGYMAPEIINGDMPTPAADIYSFGVLIYEVIAGRLPFVGMPHAIAFAHRELPAPKPSTLGVAIAEDVDAALLSPLAKAPQSRPRNASDAVRSIRSAHHLAERKRWRARELPRRLSLAFMFSLIIALLTLQAAATKPLEKFQAWTIDMRFGLQPRKPPDSRVLIICVDDATLAADQTLLGDRAEEFGLQLERVFAAGAEGIAIDFLLPRSWSRSAAFSQFVLKHAEDVTLAAFSTPRGETVGMECLSGLTAAALGPARSGALFGYVNLDEDWDGVSRRARTFYPGQNGERLPTWARHSARTLIHSPAFLQAHDSGPATFWIDYSINWEQFDRISWVDLSRLLDADPSRFKGRLVLVGGDFVASGDDFHRIPDKISPQSGVSGVILEAIIVNTILSGIPFTEVTTPYKMLISFLICISLIGAILCFQRASWIICVICGVGLLGALIAALLFRWTGMVFPAAGPSVSAFLGLASGLLLRPRLAAFPIQDMQT